MNAELAALPKGGAAFFVYGKAVQNVLLSHKQKSSARMRPDADCHGQSASGAGAGGFLTDRVQERDREYRSS